MSPTRTIYTVEKITAILRETVDANPTLQALWVRGEISGFSRPKSGHVYFTLKDARSQIKVAIFKPKASRLKFPPKKWG